MSRWPHRRTTRRALLAGGVGAAAAVALGLEVERRANPPEPASPIGDFSLGLNVSGLEDPVAKAATPEMLDTYASYGVRRLRLQGNWDYFQPAPHQALDADYVRMYLDVIREAGKREMTVLPDPCHNYGGRTIGGTPHKLGDGTLTNAMLADFWTRFVQAAGDLENIDGWDLMEEPNSLPGDGPTWVDAAQESVGAIRRLGDDRPITVAVYAPGSHEAWTRLNLTLQTVTDPLDRLIFDNHVFLDRNDSGAHEYWDVEVAAGNLREGVPLRHDVGARRLEPFVAWLRKYDLRGSVGETGVGWRDSPTTTSSAGWQAALDATLEYCRDQGLPTYAWGAGQWLARPYPLSLEPTDGVAAPQWQVLERYLPDSAISPEATPTSH